MKITGLKAQKRGARRNLELDGEFYSGIDEVLIVEFDLYSGKEITQELLEKVKNDDEYHKCLKKSFDIMAIRLNSEKELQAKLLRKFDDKTVRRVIRRVKELGYVNDQVFLESWVAGRESSHGEFVLRRELSKKRIDKFLIEKYFNNRDKEDDYTNANIVVKKKKWPKMNKQEQFKKIGSYLARRGFSYDIIKRVIEGK